MTHIYLVEGDFSFQQKANSPDGVRKSLIKSLRHRGLNEVGFQISISRIKSDDNQNEEVKEKIISVKKKPSIIKRVIKKAIKKKKKFK